MGSCFSKYSSKLRNIRQFSILLVLRSVTDTKTKIKVHNSYIANHSLGDSSSLKRFFITVNFFNILYYYIKVSSSPEENIKCQSHSIQETNNNKTFDVNYKNIPNKIHKKISLPLPTSQVKGLVGLSNLGNTCFINAGNIFANLKKNYIIYKPYNV